MKQFSIKLKLPIVTGIHPDTLKKGFWGLEYRCRAPVRTMRQNAKALEERGIDSVWQLFIKTPEEVGEMIGSERVPALAGALSAIGITIGAYDMYALIVEGKRFEDIFAPLSVVDVLKRNGDIVVFEAFHHNPDVYYWFVERGANTVREAHMLASSVRQLPAGVQHELDRLFRRLGAARWAKLSSADLRSICTVRRPRAMTVRQGQRLLLVPLAQMGLAPEVVRWVIGIQDPRFPTWSFENAQEGLLTAWHVVLMVCEHALARASPDDCSAWRAVYAWFERNGYAGIIPPVPRERARS